MLFVYYILIGLIELHNSYLLIHIIFKFCLKVRFYEEDEDGRLVWEGFGEFQPSDVHKQYGICFRTPRYHNLEVSILNIRTISFRTNIYLRCT